MKKLLIVSTLLIGLVQCKKDDAPVAAPEFNATNVAGVYKATGLTVTAAGIEQDVFATQYPACNKDDNHVFTAAGMYSLTDIGTLCSPPSTAISGTFTTTTTPSKKITFNGTTYDVVSFTALTMVVAENVTITIPPNTIAAVRKLTLTRQ